MEEQNFSTLIEFINAMEVREDDEEFKNPVDLMFDALEAEKPNHFAVRQYKKYKLAAGDICSKWLLNHEIEIPVVHLARFNEGVNRSKPVKDPYGWGSSTIVNILKKREYLGHTINFKTRKHFKDKKSHYVSEDEWTIFENTHEAIIDQQTFDLAQKIRSCCGQAFL